MAMPAKGESSRRSAWPGVVTLRHRLEPTPADQQQIDEAGDQQGERRTAQHPQHEKRGRSNAPERTAVVGSSGSRRDSTRGAGTSRSATDVLVWIHPPTGSRGPVGAASLDNDGAGSGEPAVRLIPLVAVLPCCTPSMRCSGSPSGDIGPAGFLLRRRHRPARHADKGLLPRSGERGRQVRTSGTRGPDRACRCRAWRPGFACRRWRCRSRALRSGGCAPSRSPSAGRRHPSAAGSGYTAEAR